LAFSRTSCPFIGNLDNFGLKGVLAEPNGQVPELLFSLFQGMFAAFTPALAIGAAAERGRVLPAALFVFVWGTLVYDPIVAWTWNPRGWASKLGVLDYAGGTPVHIASGTAALAYSWMLGTRRAEEVPVRTEVFANTNLSPTIQHMSFSEQLLSGLGG
jgi:ammonium transporter, Amt family